MPPNTPSKPSNPQDPRRPDDMPGDMTPKRGGMQNPDYDRLKQPGKVPVPDAGPDDPGGPGSGGPDGDEPGKDGPGGPKG